MAGPRPDSDAEGRFRLMFEGSADAILLLDTGTNRFVEYNQATLDMLRCSREELRAMHPSELSPPTQPDGRPSFEKANEMIATAVARGNHRFEWIHRSRHRSDFPVEVLLTPIQTGAAPTLLVVWRDITERKQGEEALRQAQKLESLGVLASGIAHDFNNLLAVMASNVALLRRALPKEHEAAQYVSQVESAVFRAAELTRQMLAYGGKGAFVIEPVDLSRTVKEIADLLRVSIPRRVQLSGELAEALPGVRADRAQLQQVVMNLVTNAAEAIGGGQGTITLRTSQATLDGGAVARDFAGQELRPGAYVVLTVRDTGVGMSADVLGRIFDPFFTTKQQGRGLGLSALRGIVRSYKGGLKINSAPGAGTTFEVFFPSTGEPARPPPRAEATPPAVSAAEATVLLVEDEPLLRVAQRGLLECLHLRVLEAPDGERGLELFREHGPRIAFVLLDLTMPGMGGHATLRALRRLQPSVKVVVCSGWAENDLAEQLRDEPPTAILTKPFTQEELQRALAAVGLGG
ncbi:MAG: response regulator [Myxococcales bacterium]|nr:response regulator [Myxococcales bacterium]